MDPDALSYEDIARLALQLPPADKIRLIERLAYRLKYDHSGTASTRKRPALGALAHLGPAPSAEDIDQARRWCLAASGDGLGQPRLTIEGSVR